MSRANNATRSPGFPFLHPSAVLHSHWERKCADTTGTVLVPWAGHFQCWNIFQIKYTEATLSNQTALGNSHGLKLAKC